jgi:CheY-like chemotaxis protein
MYRPSNQKHILVVDDEEAIRYVFERYLNVAGYRVATAESAEAAIEIFPSIQPDLLITDLRMPGMNGADLIRTLAATHPELRTILMSANPIEIDDVSLRTRILRKPVSMGILVAVIESMFAK